MVRTRLSSVCPIQVRFTRFITSEVFSRVIPGTSGVALANPRASDARFKCFCLRFLVLLMFALTCNTEIEVNMSLNWLQAHGVQSPFTKCHQQGGETLQNAMSSKISQLRSRTFQLPSRRAAQTLGGRV